jgi:hypothetical protein
MLLVQCLKILEENETLTINEDMVMLLIKCLHPLSPYLFYI